MPEDLERVQALARQYNQNKSVAQAVALHLEQTKNQQPPNPEVETFLAQYPQIQAHAAARLRALPKEAQTNVLMRGGLGSARDPTAMLLGRIRQVDPFNTTWVPHTPGMQPFPTQSSIAIQQVAKMVPDKPLLPEAKVQDKEKEPYEGEYENLTALAEGELMQYAGSKAVNSGKAGADPKKPMLSDWRRARPSPGEEVAPSGGKAPDGALPVAFPPFGPGGPGGPAAVSSQPAPALPPAPMSVSGAKFSPPGIGVAAVAKTKSVPPLPPGSPALGQAPQMVAGGSGIPGHLQSMPGPPAPPAAPVPATAPPLPTAPPALPAPSAPSAPPASSSPGLDAIPAKSFTLSAELESKKNNVQSSLANLAASLLGKEVAGLLGPKQESEQTAVPASDSMPSTRPASLDLNSAARAAEQAVFGAGTSSSPSTSAGGAAGSTAIPATTGTGAHPKTAPPPNLPAIGPANGYSAPLGTPGVPGKVASALDAPLTEAQIATLPPALQAVLRKKQAEQGAPAQTSAPAPLAPQMSPGVSSGVPPLPPGLSPGVSMDASASSSLPLEPVAPAADDLTPEQRAVLAQIRQKQEEREKKEAEEKAQKQQAQQAVAAETAYQNFWVQRQMASLMSLYQQGHALQQERKTAAPPTAQSDYWEGDWTCAKCGDHQFARNRECRNCGAPRTQ